MEHGARGVLDGAYSMSGAQWSVRHEGGSIGAYGGQYKGWQNRGAVQGAYARGHTGGDGRVQHERRSIERIQHEYRGGSTGSAVQGGSAGRRPILRGHRSSEGIR